MDTKIYREFRGEDKFTNSSLDTTFLIGFIACDIVRMNVSFKTIALCKHVLESHTDSLVQFPDFVHAIANWKSENMESDLEFIYYTLIPLVKTFIGDDNLLFYELVGPEKWDTKGNSNDSNSNSKE